MSVSIVSIESFDPIELNPSNQARSEKGARAAFVPWITHYVTSAPAPAPAPESI